MNSARQLQRSFPDGAYFVALAPVSDAELVPATLAAALGVVVTGASNPLDAVILHLRKRRTLLVLDNFEQVTDAAPTLAEILKQAVHLKVRDGRVFLAVAIYLV